ncbi:hypothetical protein EQ500_02810 [Lactobacillus sp. XV13L]|nr:hypothetical protein [Lactobacillus sp. XV13L]
MKKFYQIGGLIIIVGLALFIVGKLNNGNQDIKKVHTGISRIANMSRDKDDGKDNRSKTFVVKKFTKVKFDTYEPDIQISSGNKYQVTIAGEDLSKVKAEVKDQELTISDAGRKAFAHDEGTYQVIITVPNTNAIKEATGSCHESAIYLNDLVIPDINFKANYGDVAIDNVDNKRAHFQLKEGTLKVTDSTLASSIIHSDDADMIIANSKFKVTAFLSEGDVKVRNSKLLGNSSFKANTGDFKMNDAPKITYDLSTDPNSDIKFRGHYKLSHFTSTVSKTPTLKVTSKDGDITID